VAPLRSIAVRNGLRHCVTCFCVRLILSDADFQRIEITGATEPYDRIGVTNGGSLPLIEGI